MNERKNIGTPLTISYNMRILKLNMEQNNQRRVENVVSLHAIKILKT